MRIVHRIQLSKPYLHHIIHLQILRHRVGDEHHRHFALELVEGGSEVFGGGDIEAEDDDDAQHSQRDKGQGDAVVEHDAEEDQQEMTVARMVFPEVIFFYLHAFTASSTRPTEMISMPAIFCFGALALGIMAIVKPSFAASFNRS
jgi:hypothetical protein